VRHAWVCGPAGPPTDALVGQLSELGYAARRAAGVDPAAAVADVRAHAEPDVAFVVAVDDTLGRAVAVVDALRRCAYAATVPAILAVDASALRAVPACAAADEILVLGAPLDELRLRIARAWQRAGATVDGDVLVCGGLRLDPATHATTIDGHTVELTPLEHRLLRFLLLHPSRVFTREALLDRVWGHAHSGAARTVDVQVRRLRARLGPEHGSRIETVRAVGYRFCPDAGEAPRARA
jgi:DNA-binding response OmpR family regulator